MFDSHAHLDFDDFKPDRQAVLERARAIGVEGILSIGIDLASSLRARELAAEADWIFASAGIHPNLAGRPGSEVEFTEIRAMVLRGEFEAIGETGMDLYRNRTAPQVQEAFFRRHLDLALESGKPLVIHCREAHEQVTAILEEYRQEITRCRSRIVMHCFGAPESYAGLFCDMGLFVSFAGNATYKNAGELRRAAVKVPLEQLLSETDCPFLAPVPLRGKRNEPALMTHTVDALARVKGVDREEIDAHLTANARRFLFG